jgi:dsDNA-specific endonuclease/ATPase MutS2
MEPEEPFLIEISDVFDLHSVPPRDVVEVISAYLEAANEKNWTHLRIIHGKGIGVQREAVRRVLERTPFVESFQTAPEGAGGWGATLVTLRKK